MKNIVSSTRSKTASHLYNTSDAEIHLSAVDHLHGAAEFPSGARSPGAVVAVKPLAQGGSKDPHVPLSKPKLQFSVPAREFAEGIIPGMVRLFYANGQWSLSSVTDECARRLLREGLVELMRTKKGARGVRVLITPPKPPVKVVIIRSQSLGKPYLDGATWMQPRLPDWVWHELFYSVMASCRPKRIEPWTWDEIFDAAKAIHRSRRPRKRTCVTPSAPRNLMPPLKTAA